jgi:drug/metabolite transporter (DMT)-like permease
MRPSPALAWMSTSSFGFAVMAAMVKVLAPSLGQFWMVFLRTGMTALVFLVVLAVFRRPLFPKKGMALLVFRGLAGFGGISCLFYGTMHLPLAVATLLNWCSLIFVILFSGVFLKERISGGTLSWIGVSIVGLVLLVLPGLIESGTQVAHLPPFAIAIGLLGAVFSAMAMTAVRAAATRFSAELIIFHFSALAAILAAPMALHQLSISGASSVIFSSSHLGGVLVLGISGSAAQYAMTRGYAVASAGLGSALSLLTSAFSAIIGWYFFDERLSHVQWVGILILAAGVVCAGMAANRPGSRGRARGLARTHEIS